jgi:hypothetical protein
MSTTRNYEKVSGGSNNRRWEPHKSTNPVYDEKNPAKIEGYYSQVGEITSGPNGAFTVHEIQTLNPDGTLGEAFDVSLGVGLDNTLSKIPLGTWICIMYKGKKDSKTPGRRFNDTEVFQDKGAIPYNQLTGKASVAAPAGSQAAVETGNKNPVSSSPFPEDDDGLPF